MASSISRHTPYADLPQWLTIEEFQALWGVSRNAVYDAVRRGDIPHQKFGRIIRIPKSAVKPPDERSKESRQ